MKTYENRAVFTGRVVVSEMDEMVKAETEDRVEAEELRRAEMDRFYDDDYDPIWIPDCGLGWGRESGCLMASEKSWMREALLAGLARKVGPVLGRIAA